VDNDEKLWREYTATLDAFWRLGDFRFRLLALLPPLTALGVGLLTADVGTFLLAPIPRLLIALLGFAVTLGIIFYDQRNSQLYAGLAAQARELESQITAFGGVLRGRPPRTNRLFGLFKIWHDRGLALIYGATLGAWFFPVAFAVCVLLPRLSAHAQRYAFIGSIVVAVLTAAEIHRLDRLPLPRNTTASAKAGA
jgi:hypothetical protein